LLGRQAIRLLLNNQIIAGSTGTTPIIK
jgi:hypothetical protein